LLARVQRFSSSARFYQHLLILVFLVLSARLVAMWLIPLNDSTEARYAEIARLMLTSHDWVRLMHYPGQYFWAKPPLSTWLSAFSMGIFGIHAFSARLPAWVLSLICLGLSSRMAYAQFGAKAAFWATGVLATTLYFVLDAGTVMTDPALLTCVTLVMVGFWLGMQEQSRFWAYLTFVGWGLGLLAKGLVMGVFSVLPLMVWLSITQQWRRAIAVMPWITGSCLTLLIALPWYIMAETRMPGFLSYFVVGEHFMRFIKPGWTGDLYGFAHQAPWGMIWVYFIMGSLPWSPLLLTRIGFFRRAFSKSSWMSYLCCFCFLPLLFFTFARNIIYPYVFPVLPAFALLITTVIITDEALEQRQRTYFYGIAIGLTSLLVMVGLVFNYFPKQFSKSNNVMVAAWEKRHAAHEHLIYALNLPEYSSMFYSQGQALATRDAKTLCQWLTQGPQYLVLDSVEPSVFQGSIEQEFKPLLSIAHRQRVDAMYHIDHLPKFCAASQADKA